MVQIYIAFVDTPGIFAFLIRKYLKQRYIHVVIAADKELSEAYSIGRRNPAVPYSLRCVRSAIYCYGIYILERVPEPEFCRNYSVH